MNADTLVYGLTEDQQTQLYYAKHLLSVLAELSLNGYDKSSVTLNPESLGVIFSLLHDKLTIDYQEIAPIVTQDSRPHSPPTLVRIK